MCPRVSGAEREASQPVAERRTAARGVGYSEHRSAEPEEPPGVRPRDGLQLLTFVEPFCGRLSPKCAQYEGIYCQILLI